MSENVAKGYFKIDLDMPEVSVLTALNDVLKASQLDSEQQATALEYLLKRRRASTGQKEAAGQMLAQLSQRPIFNGQG